MFGRRAQAGESASHRVEFARCRALKRKNRLLLVTHRKDRAAEQTRAGADKEFSCQRLDDTPLLGAGILRFIDQHVVDPAIEFVMNPGRIDPLEQVQGSVDQIVIVEEGALVLFGLVAIDDGGSDRDQGGGTVAASNSLAALLERDDAIALCLKVLRQSRMFLGKGLGDDHLTWVTFVGQEDAAVDFGASFARQFARRDQPLCLFLFGLGTLRQYAYDTYPARGGQVRALGGFGVDPLDRIIARYAEACTKPRNGVLDAAGF